MKEKLQAFFSFISEGVWDISPSSPVAFVIYLGLITVFCVIMIIYFAKKAKKSENRQNIKKELTLDDLLKIAKSSKSKAADLMTALMLFNEKFTVEQNKEKSLQLFEKILNHDNRHKKLFDYFHGSILPKNIKFKNELDELEKKALNK